MIFWYWYLLSVAALSFAGYITLNILLTAALAVVVHGMFQLFASRRRLVTGVEAAAAAAAALALLWRESFLPPFSTLVSFLGNAKTRPSTQYLLAFILQFVNFRMLAAGIALLATAVLASRKKPLWLALSAYFVFASAWKLQPKGNMALDSDADSFNEEKSAQPRRNAAAPHIPPDSFYDSIGKASPPSKESPPPEQSVAEMDSRSPKAFFKMESGRIVRFAAFSEGSPPFDVLILHICSLSWKDIKDSGSNLMPFLSKFDYVFTNFSAACSYSGPSALRVLKSACGQSPHILLYAAAPAGCYLMDDLRRIGFKTFTMYSHDGEYDGFAAQVQKYGHADAPLGVAGLPVEYRMFDETPLYDDGAALHKFWTAREKSGAPRAALYFNTANLHIGTHKPGVPIVGPEDASTYNERLGAMIAQLEEFFSEVESSGRNAVVIFVPEHGAALSGTKMQAKDVRDIPLPPIATVPVAVKLLGKSFYADVPKPQVIAKPASLYALAWLIAEFVRHNPYTKEATKPDAVVSEIPGTQFMAEDENAAVMRMGLGHIYRQKGEEWASLPDYAEIPPGTIPSPEDFMRAAR